MKIIFELDSLVELGDLREWLDRYQIRGNIPETIGKLGLSVRTVNCLRSVGIERLAELIDVGEIQLMRTPNLGRKGIKEIHDALAAYGLEIGN